MKHDTISDKDYDDMDTSEESKQSGPNKRPVNLPTTQPPTFGPQNRSGNTGVNAVGQETPVDPFKYVSRGMPPTATSSLPYYQRSTITVDASNKLLEYDLDFRMNSIYDIVADSTNVDLNTDSTGVLNVLKPTSEGGAVQPMWRDFYKSIYKYYSVLACRWNIKVQNLSTRPIYFYTIYRNSMYPPQGVDRRYMQFWPGTRCYRIAPLAKIVTTAGNLDADNNAGAAPSIADASENAVWGGGKDVISVGDQWYPGKINREIRDDTEAKTWIEMESRPSLIENLVFRWVPEDQGTNNRTGVQSNRGASDVHAHFKFRFELNIEYLVQFKDQVIQIKYPVTDNPLVLTPTAYTTL